MSKRTRRSTSPRTASTASPATTTGSSGTSGASTTKTPPPQPAPGATASTAGPGETASTTAAPGRASAARSASATSSSPSGTARAGRRPRARTTQRSFFERYRSLIVGGGILGGLLLFGGFVFLGSTGTAYACESQLDPEAPQAAASASPQLGQVVPDMGRAHVNPGTQAKYLHCPPGSGPHYNLAGRGPIPPRFYAPDSAAEPQGWIHNLEHGGMVILYSCATAGSCSQAELDELRALVSNFPASPVCNIQGGVISPVIARFDTMKAKFAGLVWNRTILQDELDIPELTEFWAQSGERNNPERQCAPPAASPSVSFDSPAGSDAASPAASPASS